MYSVECRSDVTIIHALADLDSASSAELDSLIRLAEHGRRQRVVVAMISDNTCYSSGLSVLVLAHNRIGCRLIVVAPALSRFRRTFEITGLSKLLQTAPSIQTALDPRFYPAL